MTAFNPARMSFSELIGHTREPNSPSGGATTIDLALRLANLPPFGTAMEIGCATGYTCLEMAALRPDLRVEGVDVSAHSITAAVDAAADAGLTNVRFQVADARSLPFASGSFDLVSCGNVPAFVNDRSSMIAEAVRVTRGHGVVLAMPIYYVDAPKPETIEAVSEAIGARIEVWDERYWRNLYLDAGLQLRHTERWRYRDIADAEMAAYAAWVLETPANTDYSPDVRDALQRELLRHYRLFNANNRSCGFSLLVFRKPSVNFQPILFETTCA